jgi:hypothetical protein
LVGRSLAWLLGYRRLQAAMKRRADIIFDFVHLACALSLMYLDRALA